MSWYIFFFKQKTAYEMRISDWSSECALPICQAFNSLTKNTTSNDGKGTINLSSETTTTIVGGPATVTNAGLIGDDVFVTSATSATVSNSGKIGDNVSASAIVIASDSSSVTTNFRSEEHKSEIQSLLRLSYAVFC